jgi:hypothetical protein
VYNDFKRKIVVGMATCLAYSCRKPGKPVIAQTGLLILICKDFGNAGSDYSVIEML